VAVGGWDNTVRLLSLDPNDLLNQCSTQALPAAAESLIIAPEGEGEAGTPTLYLNVGLSNGVLQRTEIDPTSGNLTDTRTRFLGPGPVKLFSLTVQGRKAVLALSSRPWLSFSQGKGRHCITPLSYEALQVR
jgi:splicing factor 3B subunit 3